MFGKYEEYSIRFISNAICKSLFNLPITLRQNRRFSYLYIDDLMPILELFIEKDPQHKSYNIVPDSYDELRDIAYCVANMSGNSDVKIANDGYGLDYYGSNALLKKEFKNVHFTKTESAISQLYDWYCKNINLIDQEKLTKDR